MASSKVMASTSPSNPDLPLQTDHTKNFGSMNMEDLLKNIYGDADAFPPADSLSRQPSKTVDEVWKEIVTGGAVTRDPEMTLEDFLTKAGAVQEDDVRIPPPVYPGGQFPVAMQTYCVEPVGFGSGSGSGRGKRRVVEEAPVDKATQQKQRRMIKNRESAARSRERKQAYTVELETLVTQLEEENARLLKQEAEQTKKRFKELMENLIPVVEKRRPPRVLGRTNSM